MLKKLLGAIALTIAASAAQATTYIGSLTAGGTTANYSITTDGTLGVLSTANIVAVSGNVTSALNSTNFNADYFVVFGNALQATTTTLSFDFGSSPSAFGLTVLDLDAPRAVICLSTGSSACDGVITPRIVLAADANADPQDYEAASAAGVMTIGVAVVPEPAQWAMLIGGFGLAGAAMRRRRAVAAIA